MMTAFSKKKNKPGDLLISPGLSSSFAILHLKV